MEDKDYRWWEHQDNKTTIPLPVSIVNSVHKTEEGEKEYWVIANNSETNKLFGKYMHGISQADTKEEAITRYFESLGIMHDFMHDRWLSYQRWVPFILGPWKDGGKWFSIFGIHFSFRKAKPEFRKMMKGGKFIPFTNLNISIHSYWKTYKTFRKELEESRKK